MASVNLKPHHLFTALFPESIQLTIRLARLFGMCGRVGYKSSLMVGPGCGVMRVMRAEFIDGSSDPRIPDGCVGVRQGEWVTVFKPTENNEYEIVDQFKKEEE